MYTHNRAIEENQLSDARKARHAREQNNALLMGFGGGAALYSSSTQNTKLTTAAAADRAIKEYHKGPPRVPVCVERIKQKISKRAGIHGFHGIERLLTFIDENGDGVLSKEELKYAFEDYGIRINNSELDELFEYFDEDGNGSVTYDEFLRCLRGPMNRYRKKIVEQAYATVSKNSLDETHGVTLEDLEEQYNTRAQPDVLEGKTSAGEALRDFLLQWKSDSQDHVVAYDEFLEYYKYVSATISSDEYFKALLETTWDFSSEESLENNKNEANLKLLAGNKDHERDIQLKPSVNLQYRTSSIATESHHPKAFDTITVTEKKRQLPDWVRFDKLVLKFKVFTKEVVHTHKNIFDHISRDTKTITDTSYTIRHFVLSFFMQDKTISMAELQHNNESWTGKGSKVFLSRTSLNDLQSPLQFLIGSNFNVRGKNFQVYDMDVATKDYLKEEYPNKVFNFDAFPLPKDPNPPKQPEKERVGVRQRTNSNNKDKKKSASLKFIENDGKILQYDCIWDDTSLNGELRKFKLYFHLSDDTLELREVNERNSGRPRMARLNLNRQKLPNPRNPTAAPYVYEDFEIGGEIYAFGRNLKIIGCNDFTRAYTNASPIDEVNPVDEEDNKNSVELLSHTSQKIEHLEKVIRATNEQRSNFATVQDQKRIMTLYFRKYSKQEDKTRMLRAGFRCALSGFSCFGADADLLFEEYLSRDKEKEDVGIHIDAVVESIFTSKDYHENVRYEASRSNVAISQKSIKYTDTKLGQMMKAINSKVEISTNWGDFGKKKRLLHRLFINLAKNKKSIKEAEFKTALTSLNCWDADATYLFRSYKLHPEDEEIEYAPFINDVLRS